MNNYQTRHARRQNFAADRAWQRGQNTTAYTSAIKLGPVSHTIIVALMVAVLGLIYLSQVTRTSSYAYELNEARTTHQELVAQNQDLQIQNARAKSLAQVEKSDVAKAMTSPESTDFAR